MHRFYLLPDQCKAPTLFLTEREAHHALDVLRLRPREQVVVLDGAGHQFSCEVQNSERTRVALAVVESSFIEPLPYRMTLAQALPKGKIIDAIIQKATELETYRIVPLLTQRVVARLDDEDAAQKAEKWELVAIEAIKQSGSAWLPHIETPVTLEQFLAQQEPFELKLVGSLQAGSNPLGHYTRGFRAQHGRNPNSICVFIGPEGDFSPAELEMIQSAGALPMSLGRLVLRSETAAIYCLSVLKHEMSALPEPSP
jgi:16S rRNA (uracil1498-N3)-methyltransferase